MSNTKTGEIVDILPTESGTSKSGKDWKKLNFAIDTKEQYNSIVAFEVFGEEKCDNFLKYNKIGKMVSVEFNLSSNKWKDKYFTSASAWKISSAEANDTALNAGAKLIDNAFEPAEHINTGSVSDLPF
jgi:hypothetical protein